MPKITAISLVLLWIFHVFFQDYEYAWILRTLMSVNVGCAYGYLWIYDERTNFYIPEISETEENENVTK